MRIIQALALVGFAAALAATLVGDRTLALWSLGVSVGACFVGMMRE